MPEQARNILWDDDWWPDPSPMGGSAHYVSSDKPSEPPSILVPDGAGEYRPHQVVKRPKGKMGF